MPGKRADNKAREKRPTIPNGKGTGRPTLATPELKQELLQRLAAGETLLQICEASHMPHVTAVHQWLGSDEAFSIDYARAREQQARVFADQTLQITDAELQTHEQIGRARLRMQARQWLAGKYNAQFSDKQQTQINVGVQVVLPEGDRAALIRRRDAAAAALAAGAITSDNRTSMKSTLPDSQ